MDSILISIKQMLGLTEEITSFDLELVMHINTVLGILNQLGACKAMSITGSTETWEDLIEDMSKLEMVKTYIYMKVRMIFDPPSGSVVDIFNKQISELEWRINVSADSMEK